MNALPCPSSIDARWAAGAVRSRRRGPHPESWAPSKHRAAFSRNFLWDFPTTHLLFLLKWKGKVKMNSMSTKLSLSRSLQEVKRSTSQCRICLAFSLWQCLVLVCEAISFNVWRMIYNFDPGTRRCQVWVTSSRPDWVSTHHTVLLVRIRVKTRKNIIILYFLQRSNH